MKVLAKIFAFIYKRPLLFLQRKQKIVQDGRCFRLDSKSGVKLHIFGKNLGYVWAAESPFEFD